MPTDQNLPHPDAEQTDAGRGLRPVTGLRHSSAFGEIFGLVKAAVYDTLGRRRAGLMLGLQPLGFSPQGFVGARSWTQALPASGYRARTSSS